MTQHIDLYRDDLRPVEPSRELPRNLALIAVAAVLMVGWGAMAQWEAASTARHLQNLQAEQETQQAQITAASAQLAARKPDAALTEALLQAQYAVDGRRWLLGQLEGAGDEAVPFGDVLEGLGRRRPAPLWLTRIHLAEGGTALGLGGRTLEADALPAFLESLGSEPALANRDFGHFRMERPERSGQPIEFVLATSCKTLPEGCEDKAPGGNR